MKAVLGVIVGNGVENQKVIALIGFDFWPLMVARRVFDGKRVELELLAQQGYIRFLWILHVQPDELILALEDIADVFGVNGTPKLTISTANDELAVSFHLR